jgi:hypothetical protein
MDNSYTIVVYDQFGNFTKTKEKTHLNITEYTTQKKKKVMHIMLL